MVTRRFVIYALCATAVFTSPLSSAQIATKDNSDVRSELVVMQALLTEVRQLRHEVKHLAVVNTRAQLTMQQMQLQEQRLSHVSAELDGIRRQLAAVSSQHAENAKRVEDFETRNTQEQDPKIVANQEAIVRDLKEMVERSTSREASLRAQEADAALRVQNEQAKWQDLSDQVSTLSQSLESDDYIVPARENNIPNKSK